MGKHPGAFVAVVSQGPVRGLFLPRRHQRPQRQGGCGKTAAQGVLMQSVVKHARRIVVKVGSSLVTAEGRGLDHAALSRWAEQAAAAVGQMGLVQAYESIFRTHDLHAAQVLLTHEDLADRTRYLNARSTLRSLLELRVVPIINENDTVATDEIRLGDNDTLGALVTNLIEADCLVILTDQPGRYTADPRTHPDATLVMDAHAGDPDLERMAGGASGHGGGGVWGGVFVVGRGRVGWVEGGVQAQREVG